MDRHEPFDMIAQTDHSAIEVIPWDGSTAVRKRPLRPNERMVTRWRNEVDILGKVRGRKDISELIACDKEDLSIVLRHERGIVLSESTTSETMTCRLSPVEANVLWLQMADAISYLHLLRIIHDDVKPENIIWDPDQRRAVLIDFGAAIHHPDTDTVDFNPSGTPPYAPPEFLVKKKGPKGDIWALGITVLFAKRLITLPDGDWILPHVFEEPEALCDMTGWLEEVEKLRQQLLNTDSLLAQMLHPEPSERINSLQLARKLQPAILE